MKTTLTPWTRFPRTLSEMELDFPRWMNRFFEEGTHPADFKFPEVNVAETEGGVEVTVDVPGMKPEDIQLEVRENTLVVSGVKTEAEEEKGKTFHRIERRTGEFRRAIPLPFAVAEEKADAKMENGVLKVVMPRAVETQAKAIQIKG